MRKLFIPFVAAVALAGVGLAGCHKKPSSPAQQMQQGANEFGQGVKNAGTQVKQGASDTAITAKIKAKLAANTGLKSLNIHVATHNGVVTLTGTVNNMAQRNMASQIAGQTAGVASVNNQLQVQGGGY